MVDHFELILKMGELMSLLMIINDSRDEFIMITLNTLFTQESSWVHLVDQSETRLQNEQI